MNPLKKVYCRVFQFVFRVAMPLLPYREPKIFGSIEQLPALLKEKKLDSVLLVTDPGLKSAGATAALEQLLEKSHIRCTVYAKTRPNPVVQNVEEALALYHFGNCRAIIAFGGGSSMDCAKAVGARVAYPEKRLAQLKGLLRVLRPIPTLIAIPTTAGTGSEVTVTAVITDPDKKHKYTMNNFTFIPRYAVHDPAVTYTLPPQLTASTGMDALTHAVEAYIGGTTSRETRRLAEEAVKLVFENLEKAYQNGADHTARKNMLRAAYSAGIAFSKSYVGYIHAVAHSLGGQYNIPHGLANSVLMPMVLESYGPKVYKKLHRLAVVAGVAAQEDSPRAAAEKFITQVRAMNQRMGIPQTLKGIDPKDIPAMAKRADREANPLYPVPMLMDAKELEQFYYKIGASNEYRADLRKTAGVF